MELANHEAAHALACFEFGVKVYEARIDSPVNTLEVKGRRTAGHVWHERIDEAWKSVVVALAPLMILSDRPLEYPAMASYDL